MIKMTPQKIINLSLGSTFLATGGGFPLDIKLKKLQELSQTKNLYLVDAADIPPNTLACAISGIGSAGEIPQQDMVNILKKGLQILSNHLNQKIAALVAGELGIENIIWEIASLIDLPVLDADTAGRRAVPEMIQDTFFIAGESILPVVIIDMEGQHRLITKSGQDFLVEKIARKMAIDSPSHTAFIFSHVRPVHKLQKIIALNSLSTAIQTGKILATKNQIIIDEKIKQLLGGALKLQGVVKTKIMQNTKGFLVNKIILEAESANWEIIIKNEVLAILKNQQFVAGIPDSLCLLDKDFLPVHSSQIKIGQELKIYEIPAIQQWKTERGFNLFGPGYVNNLLRHTNQARSKII